MLTATGVLEDEFNPFPRRPSPRPQHEVELSFVRTHVWEVPDVIEIVPFPIGLVGVQLVEVPPFPSWPYVFFPQHDVKPLSNKTQLWSAPAEMATTRLETPMAFVHVGEEIPI